jgi:hypothetical protein
MLERRELDERIAEIGNKRNQTVGEIHDLAAFIIARDDLDKDKAVGSYGDAAPATAAPATAAIVETVIGEHGDSDFLQLIAGRDADHVWAVIDGMMETLKVMEPRLYAGVIRRINE